MRDSKAVIFPEDLENATPVVPEIPPEPLVYCVTTRDNYQRRDRPQNAPWNEFCIDCMLWKNSTPLYQRVNAHYLEISRVNLNHRCARCDKSVAVIRPVKLCKYCHAIYENLTKYLNKTGHNPIDLKERLVRFGSGKGTPYTVPNLD